MLRFSTDSTPKIANSSFPVYSQNTHSNPTTSRSTSKMFTIAPAERLRTMMDFPPPGCLIAPSSNRRAPDVNGPSFRAWRQLPPSSSFQHPHHRRQSYQGLHHIRPRLWNFSTHQYPRQWKISPSPTPRPRLRSSHLDFHCPLRPRLSPHVLTLSPSPSLRPSHCF